MSYVERHTVSVTTDSGGDATGYTPVVTGEIVAIKYNKTDFADGVDVAVTGEESGILIWTGTNVNASVEVAPVKAATLNTGAASTLTERPIAVATERIKIVVSSGGDTKTGSFQVWVK